MGVLGKLLSKNALTKWLPMVSGNLLFLGQIFETYLDALLIMLCYCWILMVNKAPVCILLSLSRFGPGTLLASKWSKTPGNLRVMVHLPISWSVVLRILKLPSMNGIVVILAAFRRIYRSCNQTLIICNSTLIFHGNWLKNKSLNFGLLRNLEGKNNFGGKSLGSLGWQPRILIPSSSISQQLCASAEIPLIPYVLLWRNG